MGNARQILRWAIPGWLLFLFFFWFVGARFLLGGQVLTLTEFATHNYASILSLAAIFAGLGVPCGFLLYQIYYWIYWRVPFPIKTPHDRGYDILKDISIPLREWVGYDLDHDAHLSPGKKIFRFRSRVFYLKTHALLMRYQHNWILAENIWDILLWRTNARWLDLRAVSLADIYHALGTSLISLWLGFSTYLLYDLFMHRALILTGDLRYIWGAIFNLFPVLILTFIFRFARTDTLRSLVAYKHDLIAYLWSRVQLEEPETPVDLNEPSLPRANGDRHISGV